MSILTLPATAAFGEFIGVMGQGAGGNVASSAQYNCAFLLCTAANTDFVVYDSQGVLTFI